MYFCAIIEFIYTMRRTILILAFSTIIASAIGQTNTAYTAYIEQWKYTAIAQQNDYGIPACITLAQGLLESGAGQSELAKNANNHFGIKCTSDWMGDAYYHDDDKKDDCFRVYLDAEESYIDHSLFLQRPRYKTLFDLEINDYKGWAKRLSECGYATDPLYPQKLIKIIEDYNLMGIGGADEKQDDPFFSNTVVVEKRETIATITHNGLEDEYVEPLTAQEEKKQFFLTHIKYKQNGCKYVVAQESDTYANIAFRLNISERILRVYNDALGRDLKVGDRVYLYYKKASAPKEKAILWVHPGESLWEISQREAVKIEKIRQYNEFDKTITRFQTRQRIAMRKNAFNQ